MRLLIPAALAITWLLRRSHQLDRHVAALYESLLQTMDANDAETGRHVRRVAAASVVLAEAAGLDDGERRTVERVALFHDIGKIHQAIYDVVHEDRKLTEDEWARVEAHPGLGARVLEPLASFDPALPEGVLAHHERWDGSGYPRGLRGTEIPLAARIVAICDAFDAMTHRRNYQAERSFEEARALIRDGAGTHFDPELASLFLRPDVQARVAASMRRVSSGRPRRQPDERRRQRAGPAAHAGAPDVSFRWRDESSVPQLPDPPRQAPHG